MTKITEGAIAPEFKLKSENGEIALSNFRGKKVILYFYPKDNTPGCTQEACDFKDSFSRIKSKGVDLIGISKDSLESHEKFKNKFSLPFILASDEELEVCKIYGVWVEKNMYGKKTFGIERSTFLIDENGIIKKIWRKVKVNGHVEDVLNQIDA